MVFKLTTLAFMSILLIITLYSNAAFAKMNPPSDGLHDPLIPTDKTKTTAKGFNPDSGGLFGRGRRSGGDR